MWLFENLSDESVRCRECSKHYHKPHKEESEKDKYDCCSCMRHEYWQKLKSSYQAWHKHSEQEYSSQKNDEPVENFGPLNRSHWRKRIPTPSNASRFQPFTGLKKFSRRFLNVLFLIGGNPMVLILLSRWWMIFVYWIWLFNILLFKWIRFVLVTHF